MLFNSSASHPLAFGLLLAGGGVNLGLPITPAVLAAKTLFGGALDLAVVATAHVVKAGAWGANALSRERTLTGVDCAD